MVRTALFIVFLAATLAVGYLIISRHDLVWDLSTSRDAELSPMTRNALRSLSFDVRIVVFDTEGEVLKRSRNLLDMYARRSGRVTYETIDPDLKPEAARRYGITGYGQAVILARRSAVRLDSITETGITDALLKLKQEKKKDIYVLSGHGEPDIFDRGRRGLSEFAAALEQSGYGVHKLIMRGRQSLPGDADLLLILGPQVELAPEEADALRAFVQRGGHILAALEPPADGGITGFLSELGVSVGNDMVVDPSSRPMSGDEAILLVHTYGKVRGLEGFSSTTVFPVSRSLRIMNAPLPHANAVSIAKTSPESFARVGNDASASGAQRGPFDIVAFVEKAVNGKTRAGVIVAGDVDFLTNAYLSVSGNKDFAAACIRLLLDGAHRMPVFEAASVSGPFVLTPVQALILFFSTVILIPSVILIPAFFLQRSRSRG